MAENTFIWRALKCNDTIWYIQIFRSKNQTLQNGDFIEDAYGSTDHLPYPVQHQVNDLLANSVVTTGVVVGGILLARDQLLWVEQLAVRASAYLILWKQDKDGQVKQQRIAQGKKG